MHESKAGVKERGPLLIAAAIVLAAFIIVGGIYVLGAKDRGCDRFRAAVETAVEKQARIDVLHGGSSESLRDGTRGHYYTQGFIGPEHERLNKPEGCLPP